MIIVNFAHPITDSQQEQIEYLTGRSIDEVHDLPAAFDIQRPFDQQVAELVKDTGLSPNQWQEAAILINPPAYAPAAATLIAELHGRMGYFPAIIRIRPLANSTPPQFEVAEIINLQSVRDQARTRR